MKVPMITPRELDDLRRAGLPIDLIDVRTHAEFRGAHAEGARAVSPAGLDPRSISEARRGSPTEPIYLICRSGTRSRLAAEGLLQSGAVDIVSVEGGLLAWERAGLPVERGNPAMSLERQVRIAAGSLVVLGSILGAFVNPGYLALTGFVGAGLIFAGITDTCGMGQVLARMPWNGVGTEVPKRRP